MNLKFNKLTIVNFGSYGTESLDLANRGYCLVTGENHCTKDNANSNGSGKSFLWSAICYALVGETIQGISSNLKNINIPDDPNCSVTLDFDVDNDHYIITRIHKPKSDMKIELNGRDISGKGIKESEAVLKSYLPDLTKNLIASTILIGQGMPNKFSSFSPAGRKELLEKLTKSDFMIEDLKAKVQARIDAVNLEKRGYEDSLLTNKTQLATAEQQFEAAKNELDSIVKPDFDAEIARLEADILKINTDITQLNTDLAEKERASEALSTELLNISNTKSQELTDMYNAFTAATEEVNKTISELTVTKNTLAAEIKRLKSIKDTCPTCGQKLPGISKPDTSKQEADLKTCEDELAKAANDLATKQATKKSYQTEIDNKFAALTAKKQSEQLFIKSDIATLKTNISSLNSSANALNTELTKVKFNKDNFDSYLKNVELRKTKAEADIVSLNNLISITEHALADVDYNLSIDKKCDTYLKRDFRGVLLTDVINYLNVKAKEYCQVVFGNDLLNLEVAGNALNITYSDKPLENLSGGERQKVDLILQFAIRDLMTKHFNYSSNILVLDEVTDFLDKTSCDAVMDLISTKLQNIDSIFIISHHTDTLPIIIDSELKIYKDTNGVSSISSR